MKTLNCKASRYAIEAVELGRQPSPEVLAHLCGCRNCENFFEERLKLRQLVASLGTVTAPADFDFRLRARLANTKTRHRGLITARSFSPGFSLGTVAVLVLLVGLGFGLRLLTEDSENPAVAKVPLSVDTRQSAALTTPQQPVPQDGTTRLEEVSRAGNQNSVRPVPARPVSSERVARGQNRHRTVVKDFSNAPAPVFRQEESLASANEIPVFPIGASYQSLNVSLDDGSGIPRTISLPSVSFGSQRVLTFGPSPTAKATEGIW